MRVLVVDDEPLARERVLDLLSAQPDVISVAQCGNGEEAVRLIRRLEPDVVFLDVQMPGLDGFSVLERLDPERLPIVVFVTAFGHYAVRAFEVHALDYLLKPFDAQRFTATLARVRARLAGEGGDVRRTLQALLGQVGARTGPSVIPVRTGDRIVPVRTDEIDWIGAEGNYVRLHAGRVTHLVRETIGSLETTLDPRRFRRIHRSAIVNVDRIRELHPWFGKDYKVVLRDGHELTLSRTYTDRLPEFLGRDSTPR
jgi:two-component system LytT family response regulator